MKHVQSSFPRKEGGSASDSVQCRSYVHATIVLVGFNLETYFISLILGKNCFGSVLRASQGTDSSSQVCDTNSIFQPLFNWSVFLLCWFLTNGGCEVSNPRLQGQRLLCAVSRDVVMCCMYFKWRRKSIWTSTKFDCRHVQKNSLLSFSYCECKSW